MNINPQFSKISYENYRIRKKIKNTIKLNKLINLTASKIQVTINL